MGHRATNTAEVAIAAAPVRRRRDQPERKARTDAVPSVRPYGGRHGARLPGVRLHAAVLAAPDLRAAARAFPAPRAPSRSQARPTLRAGGGAAWPAQRRARPGGAGAPRAGERAPDAADAGTDHGRGFGSGAGRGPRGFGAAGPRVIPRSRAGRD